MQENGIIVLGACIFAMATLAFIGDGPHTITETVDALVAFTFGWNAKKIAGYLIEMQEKTHAKR